MKNVNQIMKDSGFVPVRELNEYKDVSMMMGKLLILTSVTALVGVVTAGKLMLENIELKNKKENKKEEEK